MSSEREIADIRRRMDRLTATYMRRRETRGRTRAAATTYNARMGQYAALIDAKQRRLYLPPPPQPIEDTAHLHVGDGVCIGGKWGTIVDPARLRPPRDGVPGRVLVEFVEGGRLTNYAPSEIAEVQHGTGGC